MYPERLKMQENDMMSARVKKDCHKFIQVVSTCALVPTACLLLLFSIRFALDLPEVYKDAITRECIAVVTAAVYQPCEEGNIPKRHKEVLSAPGRTYEQIVAARNR
jgi:hypothetical protein